MNSAQITSLKRLGYAGIFILLLTLLLREFAPGPAVAPDYDGSDRGVEVVVEIEPGATGSQIGRILEDSGVVKSSLAYFRASISDTRSARIAPGQHRLETRISAKEAIEQLLDPDRIVNLVRIRDGARITEVVEELVKNGFSRQEILTSIEELVPPGDFKTSRIEGFLYPAFYSFPSGTTAKSALQEMISKFEFVTKEINWSFRDFTELELLTIASLIESEGTPDVFGKVSRVIYNRLEKGMKLQFDSTVHYVFNRRGEIALSLKDTRVPNRYNTFVYGGLPPGPIGSPTKAAIEAALTPEQGDWLYFVTVLPGQTKFTSSYDEFLEFKAEYKRNYAAGVFE